MNDLSYPEAVVGIFILNSQKEILLIKSYKWPGKWVVMGGHIEYGEPIADTCAREALEEVGLKVKFKRVIEVVEFIHSPNFHNKKKHFIALQSECVTEEEIPTIDNDEIQEARWFPLGDALNLNILEETKHTIELLMRKEHA